MKQGSTFVLVVDLQLDMSYVKSIIFTLKNKGKILTKENWSFEDGKFKLPFTQEETVQLEGRTLIEAQINFEDGNVAKSEIKEIFIKESLATRIVEGNKATEETQEIGLAIAGDVVYTDGVGGGDYKLPIATESTLGGVKPLNKTKEMTQEVGVDKDGRLFAKGKDITVDSELDEESTNPIQNKVITAEVIALRERNAELEETIEKLQIKTTTAPSPFHHITDSANMKVVDFGMSGKTEQKTTEGKNYYSGGDVSGTKHAKVNSIKPIPSGTYTISANVTSADSDSTSNMIMFYYEDGTVQQCHLSRGTRKSVVVTFTQTVEWFRCYASNSDSNSEGDTFSFTDIQIELGTVATDCEPFTNGPSPNPDYKQEIKNAGVYNEEAGRYEHKCCVRNKNFWNNEIINDRANALVNTPWTDYNAYPVYIGAGNPFVVTFDGAIEAGLNFHAAICLKTSNITNWLYTNANGQSQTQYKYTGVAVSDYIWISITKEKEDLFAQYIGNTLQIEIADTATELLPHQSTKFTLTSDRPLTKWDNLVKVDGKWYWDYKQLKLVADGSDSWEVSPSYKGFKIPILPINMSSRTGFCTQFKVGSIGNLEESVIQLGASNNYAYISLCNFYDDTLEDKGLANWKAHLNEHPLEIYTYRDESELVPLPDEEQTLLHNLETYYGVTNVYNEQGCPMWLTYVADQELHWNKKILEIQQAII